MEIKTTKDIVYENAYAREHALLLEQSINPKKKWVSVEELILAFRKLKYMIEGNAHRDNVTYTQQYFEAISEKDLMVELGVWKLGHCLACNPLKSSIKTFIDSKCRSCGCDDSFEKIKPSNTGVK